MLKYTVVIGKTQQSNGNAVDIDALEITLNKAEELDFGVFTIPATTRFENYQILDRVDITVTDGTNTTVYDPFVIIGDKVEPVSKEGYYKHTVTFIENIHKFEKILSSHIYITQPLQGEKKSLLDVLTHIRTVVPFERTSLLSSTRLFDIDTNLATYLDGIEAPQFFFNPSSLRDLLNGVSSFVNAIARLEDNNNLIFSFYNEILNTIGISEDVIHRTLENTTDKYSSSIESSIENALSSDDTEKSIVIHPSPDTWVSFRSRDVQLTDTSLELRVPYPIERITKFLYRAYLYLPYVEVADITDTLPFTPKLNIIYYDTGRDKYYRYKLASTPFEQDGFFEIIEDVDFEIVQILPAINLNSPGSIFAYFYIDVTSQLFILDQWKRLDLDRTTSQQRDNSQLKINSLYFEIGSTTITNSQLGGIFDDVTAFTAFHRRAVTRYGFSITEVPLAVHEPIDVTVQDYFNAEVIDDVARDFRIDYVPYFGSRIRLEKDNIIDHPYNTQTSINQGERIVSAERLLSNTYGLAQRTAEDEIEVKKFHSDLTEDFNLGDITDDGFVVATIHYTYFIKYFIVTYQFSRNFNRFSNRIALNQENRPFDIGLGSKTTNRNLIYTEYVELGTAALPNNSLVRREGADVFLNTLRTTKTTANKPIHFGTVYDGIMSDLVEGEGIFVKTVDFSEGNSLNFFWGFTDIIGAGEQLIEDAYFTNEGVFSPDVLVNRFIRYTDFRGNLDTFELAFYDELNDDEYDSRAFPVVTLPDTPLIGGHSVKEGTFDSFTVLKDKSESLSMNYQLTVVPHYNYADKIFVGRELIKRNNLIVKHPTNTAQYFVWGSTTETYNGLDAYTARGNKINGASYTLTFNPNGDSDSSGVLTVTGFDIDDYASWGIADNDGNLYLGVNVDEEEIGTVYFNFRNRREGMSYTFDGRDIQRSIAPSITVQSGLTSVIVNINDQQQSESFDVRLRDVTNDGDYIVQNTTNTQVTFGTLLQANEYEVGARAITSLGFASAWTTRRVFTEGEPPQIEDVYVVVEQTGIRVYWNPTPSAQGYEVQYKTDNEANFSSEFAGTGRSNLLIEDLQSNIIYIFRVRGFTEDYAGDFSDEVSGVFVDDSDFSVTAIPSFDSIDITWTEAPDSDGYQVRYKEATQQTYFTFNFFDPEQTNFVLTGLQELTFYDVGVRVVYTYEGNTLFTDWVNRQVQTTEEPPPGDLSAPVLTNNPGFPTTFQASWIVTNNNNNVVNVFYDFYNTLTNTTTTARGTIAANSSVTATTTGSEGQTRFIAAQFKQTNFNDSAVSTAQQTLLVSQPIPAPASVSVSNITTTTAYASWSVVSDATNGYRAEIRTSPGNLFVDSRTTGSSSFVYTSPEFSGLNPGTGYYVRVRSNGVGSRPASSYTNSASFTTQALSGVPNAPGNLQLTSPSTVDGDQLVSNLQWTDNSTNELGFRVYRQLGLFGAFENASGNLPANTTSYQATAPVGGQVSYFVVAYNANGESGPSNTIIA